MGRPDRTRVLAAQLSGTAAGFAHLNRCTHAEALGEVAALLAQAGIKPGTPRAVEVLTMAAVVYSGHSGATSEFWYARALNLLGVAGADLDRAAVLWAARPRSTGQVTG